MSQNPQEEKLIIEIKNRKAEYQYELKSKYEAGIKLTGTEVKSIRNGDANLNDAYCYFIKGELYVRSMHISEYKHGSHHNHEPRRDRKLLLKKHELRKLEKHVKEKGQTIIPTRLYINERGLAKLEIALAKGKKVYDKSKSIKEKDQKREMERYKNIKY